MPVKLRFTGENGPDNRVQPVYIGEVVLQMSSPQNPREVLIPAVRPGRYDAVVPTSALRGTSFLYVFVPLEVGNDALDQEVTLRSGAAVTAQVLVQDATGNRTPAPPSVQCRIRSRYGLGRCDDSHVVPGPHEFDFQGLPQDMYLLSAKAGDRDMLTGGLNITGDTALEVVLATPGAVVEGVVRTADGSTAPDSVIVLVPDASYRNVLLRYRSVIADPNGKYEIHGVAPGSYRLYAWKELEGYAYLNSEFMKDYEGQGKAVQIEKGSRLSVDLTETR